MNQDIEVHHDGALAWLILNRPEKRNAVTLAMWQQLPNIMAGLEADDRVRVIVIRGAGDKAFASGSDIHELPAVYANAQTSADYDRQMLTAQSAIVATNKPVLAMIHGACVGGGLGIATACDLRFSDNDARYAAPPARLGVVYGLTPTKRLVDLIGIANTRDLLFSARTLTAAEAWHLGLVERVTEKADLEATVREYATTVAANSAYSVSATKQVLQRIQGGIDEDDDAFFELVTESVNGPDFREGFAAFLEKRKPLFK